MSFDYDKLKNWPFEEITQTYTSRDTILYALGVGLGADPMDEQQLQYVFEEAEPFMALPTMAVVLGSPGFWSRDPETGIDWVKVLHGEQKMVIHNPLPTSATIKAKSKVILASGPIFLSTLECEISLSCHKAMFSKAGITELLTILASPVKFSLKIGFFLCGIAEDPF